MWQKATTFHKLPSEVIDPLWELDAVARMMFDNAVTYFGVTIDNALAERVEEGIGPDAKSVPRYTLPQLMQPDMKLPTAESPKKASPENPGANAALATILSMAGQQGSGVKLYKYVGPDNPKES